MHYFYNWRKISLDSWASSKHCSLQALFSLLTYADLVVFCIFCLAGLYKVVRYWPEKGKKGVIVWRYLFRRDDDSPLH